jgi:hypothetical protein
VEAMPPLRTVVPRNQPPTFDPSRVAMQRVTLKFDDYFYNVFVSIYFLPELCLLPSLSLHPYPGLSPSGE